MLDTAVPVLALRVPVIGFSVTRRLRAASWREAGIGTGGGVCCRAALPGCSRGQVRGSGDGGRGQVRGVAAERAYLGPPLCGRWSRGAGGPLPAPGVVSAPGPSGGRGGGLRDPPRACEVGPGPDRPRAGPDGRDADSVADERLPGPGPPRPRRPSPAEATEGQLPALGGGGADGAVADGHRRRYVPGRRDRGEDRDRGRRPLPLLRHRL